MAPANRRIRNDWFRLWMPYCFIPITKPGARKHVYLPVNRNHKPLGVGTAWHLGGPRVDYDKFENHFLRFTSDPLKLKGVWSQKPLYLYYDRPSSTDDYGARLHEVMRHVDSDWNRKGALL
jgi:hypothetical protein